MTWTCGLRAMGEVGACVLWSLSSVHQGNLSGNLPLEMEVSGFLVPAGDGGGDVVHGLDSLHDSDGDSSREVGNEGGGIFNFVVFGANDIQFKLVDVLLELFSSGNEDGGEPVHGFLLDIGFSESFLKIGLEDDKSPKGLVGKPLLAVDFSPCGSGPFLHVGQGIGNLPVIIVVEGLVDKKVKVHGVQPSLGCLCLSIIFIGASDANLSDLRTGGRGGGSRGSGGLVQHSDRYWR